MVKGSNDDESEKVSRSAPDLLVIETKHDEVAYRRKYLPDPHRLADAKLVCTVCSKSVAKDVRTGKRIYGHIFLSVLMCQECYDFYGDGVFSADEDGDEKYCRWCGQGGTLSLCSVCTCGFCMKCVKTNLKSSVQAQVKSEGWKCLICNPRPIYGSRAILWAAQEICQTVNEKYALEQKIRFKVTAKLLAMKEAEDKKMENQEPSLSKNSSNKKRKHESSESDSSVALSYSKKSKYDTSTHTKIKEVNGKNKRKVEEMSSEGDNSDDLSDSKVQRKVKLKHKNKKEETSGSESESLEEDSSESDDKTVLKKHKKRHDKKLKRSKRNKYYSSDSTSYIKMSMKKKLKKREKETSSDPSEEDDKEVTVHKQLDSSDDDDETTKEFTNCEVQDITENGTHNLLGEQTNNIDSTNVPQNNLTEPVVPEECQENEKSVDDTQIDDEVKIEENINVAIDILHTTINDISDLSSLVSDYAKQFSRNKINMDNLNSYEDVFIVLAKLKKLLFGVHENYSQIEKTFEENLYPWKISVGLEVPETIPAPEECEVLPDDSGENVPISDGSSKTEEPMDNGITVSAHENNINDTEADEEKQDDNASEIPVDVNNIDASSKIEESCEKPVGVVSDDVNVTGLMISESNKSTGNIDQNHGIQIEQGISDHKLVDHTEDDVGQENSLENESSSVFLQKDIENNTNKDSLSNEDKTQDNSNNIRVDESSSITPEQSKIFTKEQDVQENKSETCIENESEKNTSEENSLQSKNFNDKNFEALQEMLGTSSEDDERSSDSSDSDSEEIQLDDSDLEEILKPKKIVSKKPKKTKKKERKAEDKIKTENEVKEEEQELKEEKSNRHDTNENDITVKAESVKLEDEKLDSEAEIDMLTDLTKLKKKAFARRTFSKEDSNDSDEEESSQSDDNEKENISRKGMKYNNESKKRREEERKELFKFLEDGSSSNEDELDVTKKDLDQLEEQYASGSDSSMSLKAFNQKMNSKWKELEKEQEEMNLQLLLASDSDEGSVGGDDMVFESDDNKKKKKSSKKANEKNTNENESEEGKEDEATITNDKEEPDAEKEQPNMEENDEKLDNDNEYEQFLEGITNARTKFQGLGSSSDDDIDIKEEPSSGDDGDKKIKKELKESDIDGSSSADDSDSSADPFLESSKNRLMKKKTWRSHRLLRMKLSDTDTSDEERWWQRRLAREKKKKENEGSDSDSSGKIDFAESLNRPKQSRPMKKNEDNSSDKENKKEEENSGSSTLDLSSSESSDSSIFKKKKKKKKDDSSDVIICSEEDKKKKKKKKRRQPGDSSDESSSGEGGVIDITQKSSQGESPGKGGRKNIRKVLTKHELAAATKAAAKEEEERRKRIAARQKLFNEVFDIKEAEILEKLVLDFDPDTKTELISVDRDLVMKMKPHQAKGVKFMWDSCFESLSQMKTKKGSGCILAHCMGLGKTFQVISLVHTILSHKDTRVKTVLVVCPLSTVLNWQGEFRKWLDDVTGGKNIKTQHLTHFKKPHERARQLNEWHQKGGVMIMGYEMFRNLTNPNSKQFRLALKEVYQTTLIDPGADLVVCDEGHMLKNESTLLSKAMSRIRTLRRIVLTGTPMQNNLKEYHCMVQFVKPNLLGTRKEFLNQFVNPITNGQFVDSTETDVKVMKRRAHVLHKMLEGLVQRFDYNVLTPFLPPKHEYVISLRLSEVQVKLYQYYLQNFTGSQQRTGSQLFLDWQALGRIWTHPLVLKWCTDKAEKEWEKKKLEESEEEDIVKNEKSSSISLSSDSSSSDSDGSKKDKDDRRKKREEKKQLKSAENRVSVIAPTTGIVEMEINLISSEEDEVIESKIEEKKESGDEEKENEKNPSEVLDENKIEDDEDKKTNTEDDEKTTQDKDDCQENENKDSKEDDGDQSKSEEKEEQNNKEEKGDQNVTEEKQNDEKKPDEVPVKTETKIVDCRSDWWKQLVDPKDLESMNTSSKLILLFAILRECEMIEDKVLVFSQSLFSLDLIEHFLQKIDAATKDNSLDESLGNHAGLWTKGKDYFRLDGSSSSENRSAWCKAFNREDNTRARLFLISTRAGGLGINLTAANRVIIFDASWNPSHDVQSIFRIYRFGQKKACYVYRFIAHGTMEEKVYERQVAKQSLSSRVVDEQQVHRHFSSNDLNELYTFTPPSTGERATPALPKDRLMAELLTLHMEWIEKYHEHDSLLENIAEEELNEEERKLAWEDYENDKKRGFLPTQGNVNHVNPDSSKQMETIQNSLRAKYPNASEQELNQMLQTLMQQIYVNRHAQFKQQAQQSMSTNQAGVQQNIRTASTSSNLTPQQLFNQQRTHLFQKYGQEVNSNQMMGNSQIKQNRRMGSAQVQSYNEQMRLQQQVNLARVQNQLRIRQAMEQKNLLANSQKKQTVIMPPQKQTVNMPSQKQTVVMPSQKKTVIMPSQKQMMATPKPIQMLNSPQRRKTYNPQPTTSAMPFRNNPVAWKPRQATPASTASGRVQSQSRFPVPKLLNNGQLRVTPIGSKVNQPVPKIQQQTRQQEMMQRINQLQRQKSLQQNLHTKKQPNQKSLPLPDARKRQLEDMKNRYKASRTKLPMMTDEIVEIDDEPATPSGSFM